jgi:hypothetical protein
MVVQVEAKSVNNNQVVELITAGRSDHVPHVGSSSAASATAPDDATATSQEEER